MNLEAPELSDPNATFSVVPGVRSWEDALKLIVDGSWSGWDGDTVVQLTDGSVWRQDEYHYEYHYAYRPEVSIAGDKMTVKGMRKAVRVRRIS